MSDESYQAIVEKQTSYVSTMYMSCKIGLVYNVAHKLGVAIGACPANMCSELCRSLGRPDTPEGRAKLQIEAMGFVAEEARFVLDECRQGKPLAAHLDKCIHLHVFMDNFVRGTDLACGCTDIMAKLKTTPQMLRVIMLAHVRRLVQECQAGDLAVMHEIRHLCEPIHGIELYDIQPNDLGVDEAWLIDRYHTFLMTEALDSLVELADASESSGPDQEDDLFMAWAGVRNAVVFTARHEGPPDTRTPWYNHIPTVGPSDLGWNEEDVRLLMLLERRIEAGSGKANS